MGIFASASLLAAGWKREPLDKPVYFGMLGGCLRQFIRKPGLKNSKDEVSMLGGLGVPGLVLWPVLGQ
ncbi:MAG: hypothetical protein HQL75_05740 [Magnetococcales bacterium]|nr:hypothetical protein [Magnetococcales bacterium]